jgi:hypothetical protein
MKASDLIKEITAVIEARLAAGDAAAATWVTQEVVAQHSQPEHTDSAWFELCAYEAVRAAVRTVLRRFQPPAEVADEQIVLPGFERLQKAYLVERESEQQIVRIDQLTSDELDAKADELERIGEGCYQHAKELRRYKKERLASMHVPAVARRGAT